LLLDLVNCPLFFILYIMFDTFSVIRSSGAAAGLSEAETTSSKGK